MPPANHKRPKKVFVVGRFELVLLGDGLEIVVVVGSVVVLVDCDGSGDDPSGNRKPCR